MRWIWLGCLIFEPVALIANLIPSATNSVQAQDVKVNEAVLAKLQTAPLSPEQSLAMMAVADGYKVKLVANEPEVIDPVDAAFDDRGRMWVVEMIDYPVREHSTDPFRGRVRVLTDSDGNGVFERSDIFADQLDMPTGIALWRDGALVTVAGKLVFMRDTDGDGRVDDREVWLSGFTQDNEQLRANHPRLGPDGWWYIACGLRGGKLVVGSSDETANSPTVQFDIGSRDVRYNPTTKSAEPITGPAQFGLCWDDAGTRMFCSNRNPCTQVVFEQADLDGNPLAGIVPSTRDVLPSGEASRVFAIAPSWTTSNLHAGQFTAACGVYFRQHPSPSVSGDAFACEPTGSLVHRRAVGHDGIAWSPVGEQPTSEWLASKDEWFRPVNLLAAPGGGIMVLDMHRAVIEHPRWVPDELKNRPDGRWGNAAGRMYWVGESEQAWPSPLLRDLSERPLSTRSNKELAALIATDDSWLRQTVFRLLIERDARDAKVELERIVSNSGAQSSARCAALWLFGQFSDDAMATCIRSLEDLNRSVRVTALRLIGGHRLADHRAMKRVIEHATSTNDPWERMEALLSLGRSQAEPSIRLSSAQVGQLAQLAAGHINTPEIQIAVAAACKFDTATLLRDWLAALPQRTDTLLVPAQVALAARKLGEAVQRDSPNAWDEVRGIATDMLRKPSADVRTVAAIATLTQGAAAEKKKRKENGSQVPGTILFGIGDDSWTTIRELSQSVAASSDVQLAAIELLGFSPRAEDAQLLGSIVRSKTNSAVRYKALRAWSETGAAECDEFLVAELPLSGPQSQPTVFELILAKPQRIQALLDRLDAGTMTAKQIGAVQLGKLAERSAGPTRDGFKKHLDKILNSDRSGVISDYSSCLSLTGQPQRGREVFAKHCAACHKIDTVGVAVGPDISDSRTKTPEQLLTSILDPNRAIDNNFFRFVVLTDDGRTLEGLIAEETGDSIVLRGQNDARHVVRRESIEVLKATGVSMMPDGVESQIDKQSMADLIAFIKGWRYMDGAVPVAN